MRFLLLGCLFGCSLLVAGNNQDAEINVNSRYTVEGVQFSGSDASHISNGLRQEILGLVGEKFSPSVVDDLATRIRKELKAKAVTHRVQRGSAPDTVEIVFEVTRHSIEFDVSVPKFIYNSKQGWSGGVEGSTTIAHSTFAAGIVSDRDEMTERYAGVTGRYENNRVGTDRIRVRIGFESYHEQWARETEQALAASPAVPGIYRTRQNFAPAATFVLAKPLQLTVGATFQLMQMQYPAVRDEASNGLFTVLRYHRAEEESSDSRQSVDGGYDLVLATGLIGSDFAYSRHHADLRYVFQHGRHTVIDTAQVGIIGGRAPLFERFVLGNSTTLRGWNKFDIDPLGGTRVAHNAIDYRYRILQVFYDAGTVWDQGQEAVGRHSIGVGFRKSGFSLAVAFPLKEGRVEPIFMLGMNY